MDDRPEVLIDSHCICIIVSEGILERIDVDDHVQVTDYLQESWTLKRVKRWKDHKNLTPMWLDSMDACNQ